MNNVSSDYGTLLSSLGPLLFLIYTNDLRNCLNHLKSYLYADDIVLVESCINIGI